MNRRVRKRPPQHEIRVVVGVDCSTRRPKSFRPEAKLKNPSRPRSAPSGAERLKPSSWWENARKGAEKTGVPVSWARAAGAEAKAAAAQRVARVTGLMIQWNVVRLSAVA